MRHVIPLADGRWLMADGYLKKSKSLTICFQPSAICY
jgi:hypothetical protein